MVINASGDVGIGTTSPSTKLHVGGTITALGIKTENLPTVIDNSGIQPAQGEVEDIVQFKWSGTEVASIDTGGYVTATGYKTGGTTGFLKSDGSVDTSTYLSSSTLYSTIAFTINGNDVVIGDEVSIGSGLSFNDTTYTISSSDTLDSVTDRGATTTNDVTVGGLTANGDTITFLNESAGNKNINIRKRYDASSFINWIRSSNTDAYMGVDASENFQIGYASSGLDRSLIFTSNNSEVIRFDSSGNVGIGTTIPGEKLEVTGSVYVNSENNGFIVDAGGNARVGLMKYSGAEGVLSRVAGQDFGIVRTSSSDIHDNSITYDVYVKGDGNVGIGTTSPSGKLEVSDTTTGIAAIIGNTTHNSRLQIYTAAVGKNSEIWFGDAADDDIGKIDYDHANNSLAFFTNTAEAMRIASTGNVGIGTTSPTFKLHVEDSISAGDVTMQVRNASTAAGSSASIRLYSSGVGNMPVLIKNIPDATGGTLIFNQRRAGNTYHDTVVFKGSGNVGIGTTSPSTKLYVDGGETTFNRGNSDGAIARFRGKNAEKAVIGTVDSWFSSNVGIGTTSPSGRLHITQGGSSMTQVLIGNTGTGGARTYYDGSNGDFSGNDYMSIGQEEDLSGVIDMAPNAGSFHIQTSNSKRLTVTQDGNVGIGVVPKTGGSTWQHIQFGGTGNIIGRISDSTVDAMFANNYYVNSSNVDSHIITGAATRVFLNDGEIRFDTAPSAAADAAATFTNRLFIANTGNVGIGTTSPSYKLDVNGSFNCTSMNVTESISTSAGNVIVQNGAGIYSIKSTINTSASGTAFRIANTNDVQAARVTFVAETANYQVAKIYEVVKAGTADPVAFKVVDTGPSGEEDFSVSFSNDGGDLLCTVTNDSVNESLTLVTTIFVGGSNTSQTVSNS
jgi:hypothetical protein